MITLRRAGERRHERRRKHDAWHSFGAAGRRADAADCFGELDGLADVRLRPQAVVLHEARYDAEIITYVREGSVACEDSRAGASLLVAGEFQRRIVTRGERHSERNPSKLDGAHTFQIRLQAGDAGVSLDQEQKRFSAAERRGALCLVASSDARRGSLRICRDVSMHSALLDPGQHVVHELAEGRGAWLHVIQGEASVGDVVLQTGDGVSVTDDRVVSITARQVTELLLIDLRRAI